MYNCTKNGIAVLACAVAIFREIRWINARLRRRRRLLYKLRQYVIQHEIHTRFVLGGYITCEMAKDTSDYFRAFSFFIHHRRTYRDKLVLFAHRKELILQG